MKKVSNKLKYIIISITILAIVIINPVFAKTIVDFDICEFRETLQLLKLIGIVLTVVKILLPLLLIFMCIKDAYKCVVAGKQDELTGMLKKFLKRFAAAAIIFFIPDLVYWGVENLIDEYDDTAFSECTTCLFDTENCDIPETNPDLYEEEDGN